MAPAGHSSESAPLEDMWKQHGPNAWTHVGKVWDGTRLNGQEGLYTEADFKVGVLSMQLTRT